MQMIMSSTLVVMVVVIASLMMIPPSVSGLKCVYCADATEADVRTADAREENRGLTPSEEELIMHTPSCRNDVKKDDAKYLMDCDHYADTFPSFKSDSYLCRWQPNKGLKFYDCARGEKGTAGECDVIGNCFCDDKDGCNFGPAPEGSSEDINKNKKNETGGGGDTSGGGGSKKGNASTALESSSFGVLLFLGGIAAFFR